MIDFNYTAPELLPFRIQEVLDAPNEPHRIGSMVYVPEDSKDSSCYSELFGTLERAAQTLDRFCSECHQHYYHPCPLCYLYDDIPGRNEYDELLEWLRSDA